ncbi:MAG: hypothetical protein ABDH37_05760 [Candidatus Hydrothermales bacterium]
MLFTYEVLNNASLKELNLKAGINSGFVFIAPIGNEVRREYVILGR